MGASYEETAGPDGTAEEKKTAQQQAGRVKDEACRCKEISQMPPRKLFGLMLSDLAFWKKAKKV